MTYILNISLGIFLFGFFINGLTFIKYAGLYSAILFFLIQLIKDRKSYHKNSSLLIGSFLFLVFTIVLSIIFAYSDILPSIREFRIEFLHVSLFLIMCLYVKDKKILFKILLYSTILAYTYNTIQFGFSYYLKNPHLNFSIRLERIYSNYFEILYPFILSAIFIIKSRLKYFLGILLMIGFFELFLTGARGSWVNVFIESIIFLLLIVILEKKYIKKIIFFSIFTLILLSASGYYLFNHSKLFRIKIHQGFSPNGRENIVKQRFPIFLKHGNYLVGIGGPGDHQYIKFLNSYKATKKYGVQHKNYFQYWSDEPFLIQIFYREGLLGVFSFLFFSAIFLWQGYKFIISTDKERYKIFIIGIISSYIGYYFVRGLVEGRSFKYIVIFLTLFLITKEINEKNSISIS